MAILGDYARFIRWIRPLKKLYDEYDLDLGDELCITKKEELKTTKFELKK